MGAADLFGLAGWRARKRGQAAEDADATVAAPAPRRALQASAPRPTPVTPSAAAPASAGALAQRSAARAGAKPAKKSLALAPGFRLHEYRIDGVLGQGGFGITYLATDINLNARVAIKEYLPEQIAFRTSDKTVSATSTEHLDRYRNGLDSFLVEGRTLATFRHPNIVRVARFFEAHQTAYMVLEYERGSPLKRWWSEHPHVPEAELVRLLQPLLDGLSVVHAAGFLHRDIKPDNIQVREEDGSLVLLDFGSARQAAASSQDADIVLTPGYAPIEQYMDGPQGAWTDIYALGATLYWLVTGKKPPGADQRVRRTDPMLPALEAGKGRYSEPFLAAIDWALQPRAEHRPQSMAAWRQRLFSAHAASLGLQEALQADEGSAAPAAGQAGRELHGGLRRGRHWLQHGARRLLAPGSWPLAAKLMMTLVLAALLPMLVTGTLNLHGSLSAVSGGELRNLEQLARSTAGRLSQLVGDNQKFSRALASDEAYVRHLSAGADITAVDKAALRAKLVALAGADPDIHLIMLMNTAGTAVVSSDAEVMGHNFAFREYFKAAMQGREHVTGIVVGAVAGQAGMFFSTPVRSADGAVLGAVVLRVRATAVAHLLDEVRMGSSRTPWVIDNHGVVLYHPDTALHYKSLMPLGNAALAEIRADQRFRRDQIDSLNLPELAAALKGAVSQGHVSFDSTLSHQPEIAGYAPVRGQRWTVVVSEPRAHFEAPLQALFSQLLWSVLAVGAVSVMLALLMARSLVRPIQALTRAAEALKRGDYSGANLKVTTRDEIGQLARTFNVMIDVLRQRERESARERRVTPGR